MNRIVALVLVLGVSLALVASGSAAEANPERAKAIAEIEKLGGKVVVDEKSPDKPVIGVALVGTEGNEVTDAALDHLKGLTKLQSLNPMFTRVTDKM
jgi:hypothetical protein